MKKDNICHETGFNGSLTDYKRLVIPRNISYFAGEEDGLFTMRPDRAFPINSLVGQRIQENFLPVERVSRRQSSVDEERWEREISEPSDDNIGYFLKDDIRRSRLKDERYMGPYMEQLKARNLTPPKGAHKVDFEQQPSLIFNASGAYTGGLVGCLSVGLVTEAGVAMTHRPPDDAYEDISNLARSHPELRKAVGDAVIFRKHHSLVILPDLKCYSVDGEETNYQGVVGHLRRVVTQALPRFRIHTLDYGATLGRGELLSGIAVISKEEAWTDIKRIKL